MTIAAESAELREHVADAFVSWQNKLAEVLAAGGLSAAGADARAATLLRRV